MTFAPNVASAQIFSLNIGRGYRGPYYYPYGYSSYYYPSRGWGAYYSNPSCT